MSAGPQSAAPLLHQQAASFSPGMHALSVPAAYPQGFSAASDTAQATPPALPSVPAPAQPEFTTADSAPQQPPQPQPGDAQNVQQSQAEALQRMQEAANEPQSLAASEQAGAQPAHAAPESADCDAMYTSGEPPAGEAEQPEALNQVPSAAAEVKEAPGSLQESGSQTNLAASVGASILGNLSDARPHIAPDDTAAAQPEHDGNMVQHAGDSSGPSAPEQALAPAQDDISRPLGQAEAAKLLSVRDDLEQLGPGQPDVPCSGQGSHASHAQQPAEVSSADPAPQHSHWSGPEFRAAQQPAEEVPVGPPAAFLSGQHSFQQLPPIPMAEMAPASTHAHNIGAATGVAAVQASLPAPTVAPHTLRGAVHPLELPMWGPGHFAPAEGIHAGIYAPVSMPGAAAGSGSSLPASQTWQTAQLGGASIAPMPGSKAAFYASQGLPPSAPLPGYGVGQGPDFGLMQQPGAPGLFDPTALLGKGQAPAMNGFGEPGSPSRTIQTGKPAALWITQRNCFCSSRHAC